MIAQDQWDASRSTALALDAADPLAHFREQFLIPRDDQGRAVRYFAGNSLGLQPRGVRRWIDQELRDWADLAVLGHQEAMRPWYRYHEQFRGPLSRLMGAHEDEVVVMNSLTPNLHFLMVSFFRPDPQRNKILIEKPCFPSDRYAVQTQLVGHGLNPEDHLIEVGPRAGEECVREEDIEAALEEHGSELSLVLLGGVNFLTGQCFDMARIIAAGHRQGVKVGLDLAHAAGNIPVALHDWNADFAAWCSYKYLNGGPGAMAGTFVHQRHARNTDLPRFGGWWGNDPDTRFRMQLEADFVPRPTVDGWQLSNPSVFSLAPLGASLELFDQAGISNLREKSETLTAYLSFLLGAVVPDSVHIITPETPEARGCQLSLRLVHGARDLESRLSKHGFVCDFREPDILRAAPTPLYNRFEDVWDLVEFLRSLES